MPNAFAHYYTTDSVYTRSQATISVDTTVEGDKVTWISDTAGADITLAKYDSGRHSEYIDIKNPLIVVKCTSDSSGVNTLVKSEDGTTLFTFAADYSSTPAYAAFRLVEGNRNTASWRLA
jgi:hypothetical protein